MNDNLYFRILQLSSGHYLSTNIPSNWYDLTEDLLPVGRVDQQNEFLIENNWEPFEDYPPEYVWSCIESAAQVTYTFIQALPPSSEEKQDLNKEEANT